MKRICVFCGSRSGKAELYAQDTRRFGQLLVQKGLELVYGGGGIGLMAILADAVLAQGGKVIGVIPQSLVEKELAHLAVTELRVVPTMHDRKAAMADLSDAFAALPGAFGTADELFEILTWAQLGLHTKPIGLLNTAGFFDPLQAWLEHCVAEGFLKPQHRRLLLDAGEPEALLEMLLHFRPQKHSEKWIDRTDR
jgi:uncharacterized protein (TIGR00730 family)